jgi:hypothetical protein
MAQGIGPEFKPQHTHTHTHTHTQVSYTPIILAIQEAKIGRIVVGGQPKQKVSKTPSQPKSCVWWCTPVIPAPGEAQVGGSQSRPALGKNVRDPI